MIAIPTPPHSFYRLTAEETAKALQTDAQTGLSADEAGRRLAEFGRNELRERKGIGPFHIFIEQFRDFIIWVLIAAALISGFLQEWTDALAIIAIVAVNAFLGFIQEYRAEKSLAALKKLSSPVSKVIRGGRHDAIPSSGLVPGDLIELEAGDNVPADGRLVRITANFSVHEASLTGESTPVLKTIHPLEEKDVPLADRANMAYMGTSVSAGKALAIATSTGMRTELGKIAGMIQEIEREATPLQRKLEEFGKWIVCLCFALVAMVFVLGLLRGGEVLDMFLTAVSLAVAAIPEGLPAVVTIALALGVQRMVRRHALIRKLPSVETLGCATVICSDKTGTLTKNEMTVQAVYTAGKLFRVTGIGYEPAGTFLLDDTLIRPADHPALVETLRCAVLCNGARLVEEKGTSGSDGGAGSSLPLPSPHSGMGTSSSFPSPLRGEGKGEGIRYKIIGDPTEAALLTAAAKADIWKDRIEEDLPLIDEIPFDSERKKMTMIRKRDGRLIAFVKGAPDVLIDDCASMFDGGGTRMLSADDRQAILASNGGMADQAMRVLAVAYRTFDSPPADYTPGTVEKNLTFLGLVAMIDPPREEVKAAIEECKSAGIKTVMITGDHKNTAVAIARQLGFFTEGAIALSGEELDALDQSAFGSEVERIPVYARVSPEHKLRIVRAWRGRGEIVAMTGDGVNDAPAVKEADIGVAMGMTGTDVTKEVSDMVITDDNFASIVAAVEEGRGIYGNIQKFIHYLLSCNAGEILVMFVSSLINWPAPLLPIQILWVNLVTDGLPALALGVDPVEPGIMDRPPRPPREAVVSAQRAYTMLLQGAFIAFCSLAAFYFVSYVEKEDLTRARTAAFIVLAVSQLFHSFNCRSMTESIFRLGVFSNMKLVIAVALSFALQMAVVYAPFLQRVFKTAPLGLTDWMLVVAISSLPLWGMEIVKAAGRGTEGLSSKD